MRAMRAPAIPLGPNVAPHLGMIPVISAGITLWGLYSVEHVLRNGEVVDLLAKNDVTTPGLNHILDTQFGGGSQVVTWYIGLIDADGFTALADGDTLASHVGWTEFTDYSGSRKEWTDGAASGGVKTNAVTVDFVMTGAGTITGLFLASVSSGTGGILWSTALLSGDDEPVVATDTLKVTYTINAIRS